MNKSWPLIDRLVEQGQPVMDPQVIVSSSSVVGGWPCNYVHLNLHNTDSGSINFQLTDKDTSGAVNLRNGQLGGPVDSSSGQGIYMPSHLIP